MKRTLVISTIALVSSFSYGQTNTFPASGNTGIGTTTPVGKLEINDGNGTGVIAYFGANGTTNAKGLYFSRPVSNTNPVNIQGTLWGVGATNISLQAEGGNVGIGTTNPSAALQLGDFNNGSASNQLVIPGTYNFEQLRLGQTGNGNMALEFVNHMSTAPSYGIKFLVNVDSGFPGLQLQYAAPSTTYAGLNYVTGFCMNTSGDIGVGTTNTQGYKLAVNGSAIATSVTVKLYADWPDYVFKKEFRLPTLSALKTYIDQNHHLPEMPTEQQIIKDGLNLGEMNKLLVKKVEELTLYLIEQQKVNQLQQKELDELKKEVSNLKIK